MMSMDVNKIAELANIMKTNGLTLLDWTEGENRLVLGRRLMFP